MNLRNWDRCELVVFILFFCLLTGCQQDITPLVQNTKIAVDAFTETATTNLTIQETQEPTSAPTREIVKPLTPTETSTPTQLPTLMPIQQPKPSTFPSLPPAQYLVHISTGIEGRYDITSIDGDFTEEFNNGIYSSPYASFTKDGVLMVYSIGSDGNLYIYDWNAENLTELSVDVECYTPSWSSDKTKIAASCDGWSQLYIIQPLKDRLTQWSIWPITKNNVSIKDPKWSPDGKWIVFGEGTGEREAHPEDGIFVISISCIEDPKLCPETVTGPFFATAVLGGMDFDIAWSPNSQYLAVISHREGEIRIIDIENGTEKVLVEPHSLGDITGIAWSPDGEWIMFTVPRKNAFGQDIYKISPWYAEPVMFIEDGGDVIDWFTIHHPSNPGDQFVITVAGANLNVRTSPSLSSDSLMKLQPGDIITVLGGPVEAEGYSWWNISVNDEIEGWAVNIPEWYEPHD